MLIQFCVLTVLSILYNICTTKHSFVIFKGVLGSHRRILGG